ncbi:CDGSH iron-sulfur domain-containing protein [Nocardia jejuensis]|uniref:CDGSH iron-sulfur domain-containing protein n=1 Tax=Nocardia jejuensis TaxID=328049 RepID=UPI000A420A89|nr:CDGSH iron-sulfur domain-containing protein [Nocardia jejuensis]
MQNELESVLIRAMGLDRWLAQSMAGHPEANESPLRDTVIRPLTQAYTDLTGSAPGSHTAADGVGSAVDPDTLWQLAYDVTALRGASDAPLGLQEAAAALQHLAILSAADPQARIAELAALQADLESRIEVVPDGPYLLTNPAAVTDWLGVPVPALPQMALCRCGASETKPLCDGSHARIGFDDAKDSNRVPDRREDYEGVAVTVLDNRGLCAHAGFCTDRVPTVFRAGAEPFVAPSGGRGDEIERAVRACPSGALGYAVDGIEAAAPVRPPAVEVSKDGPYRVTGGIPLAGAGPRNAGASLEHYSLCRCGHSQNKPFCSGMHWYVDFHDPAPSPEPTLFEWAGGLPALTRMTNIFYGKYVPEDPLLAPLFARMSPDHPQRVAAWLGETFGGPRYYTDRYGGYDHMVAEHAGKSLTEEWRARWAQLISRAADDAGLPTDPEFRAAFAAYIEWGSRIAVENSQPGATPPPHMPVPRWWWVCNATPGSRVSALAAPVEREKVVDLPAADEIVSFARHIKPLFREMDRKSMSFVFDLWSHADVTKHGAAILERLDKGSMPCDGRWPQEHVDLFARWIGADDPAE